MGCSRKDLHDGPEMPGRARANSAAADPPQDGAADTDAALRPSDHAAGEAIEELDRAVRSQAETRHFGVEDHDTLPSQGEPMHRTADPARCLRPGQVLADRWRILGPRPLGTGGMGEVWKARDVNTAQAVAIKALPRQMADDARAVETLQREAKIGLQLEHPNICRLHSYNTDNEVDFVVMEFVNGRTLQEMLAERRGRPMVWSELAPLAEQIASALDFAHSTTYSDEDGRSIRGILHGDIKPGNIMVTPSGVVKLMDFGIAREIHDAMPHTPPQTSQTPIYASPEQFSGLQITAASDLYSFANVLYECLAGHRLVLADGNVPYQVLHHAYRPLRNQTLDVNAALTAGLAKDPADRPPNASALVAMFSGQAG